MAIRTFSHCSKPRGRNVGIVVYEGDQISPRSVEALIACGVESSSARADVSHVRVLAASVNSGHDIRRLVRGSVVHYNYLVPIGREILNQETLNAVA